MKTILNTNYNNYYSYNTNNSQPKTFSKPLVRPTQKNNLTFKGNIFSDAIRYAKARVYADRIYNYAKNNVGLENFVLKEYNLTPLEGIQTGIKVFKGLTIKEIQYLSDNLHVIAIKRGCKNMCGHCYADAKPSKREMSYEDFHSIMKGFKTLRKRMHNLDIFCINQPTIEGNLTYKTTELFYDADCMDIAIKDKKGKVHDFIDLSTELFDSLGRRTVFDTSGWHINNKKAQERALKYAEHFSNPENMEKLEQFNISFNVFHATNIAANKAYKNGDLEKASRLRNRFTTNMANTLFTFTPLFESPKFNIMMRAFNSMNSKNSKGFEEQDMLNLMFEVLSKVENMYKQDLSGAQIYVKSKSDIEKYMNNLRNKMTQINSSLNSSGRMKKFVEERKITSPTLQNQEEITTKIKEELKDNARLANVNCILYRLIDADGKVYHMDYGRFFPTEIQLNISGKNTPTPRLANLVDDFVITKSNINS